MKSLLRKGIWWIGIGELVLMGKYLQNRVGVMALGNCVGGILLVKWNWWMCAGGRLVLEGY